MHLTPEIVTLPARSFAGLQARFISAGSPDASNLQVIPQLWADFFPRLGELAGVEPNVSYGLCDCVESQGEKPSRPGEALYLAAVAVTQDTRPPRGMVVWSSPGGTFAKFIHRGRIELIGETAGFIYGQWLPGSAYDRGPGPEIERYDSRFSPTSDTSVLEIFVPIRAKT
jgi:predicted transcriptional regulator YdeE